MPIGLGEDNSHMCSVGSLTILTPQHLLRVSYWYSVLDRPLDLQYNEGS